MMRERREIVALAGQAAGGVLITLVRTWGSSYRRAGARMLMLPDGRSAGTISGGCLEMDLVRKAMWKARNGPILERFEMTYDDTAEIPYGMGCGGTVELLLEPVEGASCQALLDVMAESLRGREFEVRTCLPREGQLEVQRVIRAAHGDVVFESEDFSQAAGEEVFLERLEAPQRLVILGAGDDAKPLARMAAELGWSVVIAEGRPQLARAERFPAAERVAVMEHVTELGVTAEDVVVLMTHSYEQDRRFLAEILPIAPTYLGLLGARHRSSLLVLEAAGMAGLPLEEACTRVHAPVGLDLGGDGPEAIALAILAEAQAVVHGRTARSKHLTYSEMQRVLADGPEIHSSKAMHALDGAEE